MKIEDLSLIELIDIIKKYRVEDGTLDFISEDGGKTFKKGFDSNETYTSDDIELFGYANPGYNEYGPKIILWVGDNVEYDKSRNERQGIK